MSDFYKYVDPDYIYTDPETGVLRNLAHKQTLMLYIFLRV